MKAQEQSLAFLSCACSSLTEPGVVLGVGLKGGSVSQAGLEDTTQGSKAHHRNVTVWSN